MGKLHIGSESPVSPSLSLSGEKKKKKKKNKDTTEEENLTQDDVMMQLGLALVDDKKKKKKKKKDKSEEEMEIGETEGDKVNVKTEDTVDSPRKKKKKKDRSEEEVAVGEAGGDQMDVSTEDTMNSPKKKKKHKKNKAEELTAKSKQVVFSPVVQELSPSSANHKRRINDECTGSATQKAKKQKLGGRESIDSFTTPLSTKTVSMTSTSAIDQDSPTKKKKKKKIKDSEELDSDIGSSQSQKKNNGLESLKLPESSMESPPHTPQVPGQKKKKKKGLKESPVVKSPKSPKESKQKAQNFAEEEVDEEEEVVIKYEEEEEEWPKEVSHRLLDLISEQIPSDDKRMYRRALSKIDWSVITVDSHSAEDCQKHFSQILSKLQVYKTLPMLMADGHEIIDKGKIVSRPATAFNRFMKDFCTEERLAQIRKRKDGRKLFSLAAEAWRDLPEKQKEVYRSSYREEVANYMVKRRGGGKLLKPYQLWATEQRKGQEEKQQVLRQAFLELPDATKFRYIRASLLDLVERHKKDEKEREEEEEKGDEGEGEGEEGGKKMKRPTDGPNKEELQLYLRHCKMPEFPPHHAASLYFQELIETGKLEKSAKADKKEMFTLFGKLSPSKKLEYHELHNKNLQEFIGKFKKWEGEQDEATVLAKQLLIGPSLPPYLKAKKLYAFERKGRPTTRSSVLTLEQLFPNVSQSDISCPKFISEPKKPPATTFSLFCSKYQPNLDTELYRTRAEKGKACRAKWKELTEEQKAKFTSIWERMMEKYREDILNYVGEMNKEMRSMYLGFQRKPLYDFFKRDIFEQYPNEKYPVYQLSPNKTPKAQRSEPNTSSKPRKQTVSEGEGDNTTPVADRALGDSFARNSLRFHEYSSGSSDEETGGVPGIHPLKTPQAALGKTPVPDKQLTDSFVLNSSKFQDSSSDEEEEEEEEEAPPIKTPKKTSPVKHTKESSSEESSDDEGIGFKPVEKAGSKTRVPQKKKAMPSTKIKEEEEEESSEEEEEEEEDEEQQQPASKPAAKMPPKPSTANKKPASSKESDDDDDDDDDDGDDVLPAWKTHSFLTSTQGKDSSSEESD